MRVFIRWSSKVNDARLIRLRVMCGMDTRRFGVVPITRRLLGPPPVELDLVHGPHGSLHIFQTHKAFVEAEIMSDGVLEDQREESHQDILRASSISHVYIQIYFKKHKQMFLETTVNFLINSKRSTVHTFQVAALRRKYAKFLVNQL